MTVTKQPYEEFSVSYDFAELLDPGETIALDEITSRRWPNGPDSSAAILLGDPVAEVSGSKVIFWLTGGQAGEKHLIYVDVTTSGSQKLRGDIWLDIVEAI